MGADPLKELQAVVTLEEVTTAKNEVREVFLHSLVRSYIVEIVRATRNHGGVTLGASTRGALALMAAAKARAAMEGRGFVTPDDVRLLAVPVLAHRLILAGGYGVTAEAMRVMGEILEGIVVPTEFTPV